MELVVEPIVGDSWASTLDAARFLLGFGVLGYASVSDLKTRRVPNRTWYVSGALAAGLLIGDVALTDRADALYLGLIPIIMAVAYGLWYFYLIAGGADAKALMMLAVLLPFPIDVALGQRVFPIWAPVIAYPPTVVVFANSLLVFLAFPVAYFLLNALRGDLRFPLMFLGYRTSLERAEQGFVWVAERVAHDDSVETLLFASKLDPEAQAANLERLRAIGRDRVWVTPKIPYMVPLLGGFVAAFFLGDVFTRILVDPWVG